MRNKLSVTIISKNEEKNIGRCLCSVSWADEIIVVDSGSTDKTLEICKKFNCKVVETDWKGFGKTKKFAVEQASNNWILSLDADEEVTENLKNSIQEILQNPDADAYKIKRNSYYLGKMINHCGWNHDYPLRLFNRRKGTFNEDVVHEKVVINGIKKRIRYPMLHYTYPTVSSHIKKIDEYSKLGAEKIDYKKTSIMNAFWRGFIKFIKMYFIQKGFLDGKIGFALSVNSTYGVFVKYLKLWEKQK